MSQQYTSLLLLKGQGPAGPRVGSDMHLQTGFHSVPDHSIASGVCLQVSDAGLQACTGFLVGGVGACPLVGGIEPWPSGGEGH